MAGMMRTPLCQEPEPLCADGAHAVMGLTSLAQGVGVAQPYMLCVLSLKSVSYVDNRFVGTFACCLRTSTPTSALGALTVLVESQENSSTDTNCAWHLRIRSGASNCSRLAIHTCNVNALSTFVQACCCLLALLPKSVEQNSSGSKHTPEQMPFIL